MGDGGGGRAAGGGLGAAAPALLLNLQASPSYSMHTVSTGTLPLARQRRGQSHQNHRIKQSSNATSASAMNISQGSRGGFSMRAPEDSEGSDSEGEEEVESRPPPLPSALTIPTTTSVAPSPPTATRPPQPRQRRPLRALRQLPPALAALADLALFRRRRARAEASRSVATLDASLLAVDADEADAAREAEAAAARERAREAAEAASKAEREASAADAAVRERLRDASAAAGARADAAAARARAAAAAEAAEKAEREARRRKEEEEQERRRAAANAAAAAAEEEKKRKEQQEEEEAAKKRDEEEEQRKRQEQATAAAAEEEAKRKAAAASSPATPPPPALVASPSALRWSERASNALALARSAASPLAKDPTPAAKTRRRAVDRAITLAVQQISATVLQVDAKSKQLVDLLSSLSPDNGERCYGFCALAARVVAQCECQVALSPAFAFPLAQVVASVCSGVPGCGAGGGAAVELFDVVSGRLQAATPLCSPCWVRATAADHHHKIGYRTKEDGESKGQLESTDDFASRLRGYALFLGALVAAADAGRWRGSGASSAAAARARGWSFVASALNALPPNRLTAVVLDGFLDAGGHSLYGAYGRQFLKLLAALDEFFLPALEVKKGDASSAADADAARPAAARLRSYLHGGAFRDPPEGSVLPESDASAYDRA